MRKLLLPLAILTLASLPVDSVRAQMPYDLPAALAYYRSEKSTDRAFALSVMGLMGKVAKPASREVVDGMFDDAPAVRQAAVLAIPTVNKEIAEPVLTLVQSTDMKDKLEAVKTLAAMGKDAAPTVTALVKFLPTAPESKRAEVVETLATVAPDDKKLNEQMVTWALTSKDPAIRKSAKEALAKMDFSTAILENMEKNNPYPEMRKGAKAELARIKALEKK